MSLSKSYGGGPPGGLREEPHSIVRSVMLDRIDCVVVGAGVVGLAVARALALAGREVVVIEANPWIGNETSSRNNEVIHAGFLYPPGSLKARLCRPGSDQLYAYCESAGVAFRRIGKLMPAASEAEIDALRRFIERGRANGVSDLQLLDRAAARDLEPRLECRAALYSPSTGIIDSHGLMLRLEAEAERHDATIALRSKVTAGEITDDGFVLDVESLGGESYRLGCDVLVNAAGLGARAFAVALAGFPPERVPRLYYAKGCFYALTGPPPFRHLVVPMGKALTDSGGFTLDLAGYGKFGPDRVEWVEDRDYSVAPDRAAAFAGGIRTYYPELDERRIHPSYAGIRPGISPGDPLGDWVIEGPAQHGIENLVHMFAIESPGLTASLALADYVLDALKPALLDSSRKLNVESTPQSLV